MTKDNIMRTNANAQNHNIELKKVVGLMYVDLSTDRPKKKNTYTEEVDIDRCVTLTDI